jgi:outer membrane protein OmpA-like peptidoglycan-associated protein
MPREKWYGAAALMQRMCNERSLDMSRLRWFLPLFLFAFITAVPSARAQDARRKSDSGGAVPFVGIDLGVSEPVNSNFRAHVQTGGSASPFFGMMFNDYLGLQANLHANLQAPDVDRDKATGLPRRFFQSNINNENQWTTLLGATAGPRLSLPLSPKLDLYGLAQGGAFKGVSGRLNQWAPGLLAGAGLDVNITPELAVGLFGRWNRAYMSPHPTFLIGQKSDEQGPADAQWVTAGISMKWSFKEHAAPPPPPPPPPPIAQAPPPPPAPKAEKIVLRGVNFDFDKSNIRSDAQPVLEEAVRTLKEHGTIDIIAEGHTDGIGSDAYNMKLSHRRADAVKKFLVSHGIAADRIRTEGFGKTRPVASNDTDDGRAQNRRVELHVQ